MSQQRYAAETLEALFDRDLAPSLTGDDVTSLETALTRALLTYADERVTGRIDPAETGWNTVTSDELDAVTKLTNALEHGRLDNWLADLSPAREGYANLVPVLAHYRALDHFEWPLIASGESLKVDAIDDRVPVIRTRLILLGDLGASMMREDDNVFDQAMSDAVDRFQARHGLATDGVVGSNTLLALNISPGERSETIIANLERMRWLPSREMLGERHIEVNLASFELVAYQNGDVALAMPVVVGSPEHRTPIISDRIVNLKFAPTWTVPHKITTEELLPKLQEDPEWLTHNNFRVFADWNAETEVDPSTIDWTSLTESSFGFMLRQDPSESSALGLVRFSLTNEFDIFLHDTGSRGAFTRANRSLSHGCVRVGDPAALAEFALNAQPTTWTPDDVKEAMQADDTHYQRLAQDVPVHLLYLTAWVDESGQVQFRQDFYEEDAELLALIAQSDSQPVVRLPALVGESVPEEEAILTLALAD
jgi:murein L,D-transpeptidase YcbB/YkuD